MPCEPAAPSLIPRRPGEHRKTDRREAIKIARDFRDDRLVLIHVPTQADEQVRDLVRCRETSQRVRRTRFGERCGRELRSWSPSTPSAALRAAHFQAVLRLTPTAAAAAAF